jgi:hypothetical protein
MITFPDEELRVLERVVGGDAKAEVVKGYFSNLQLRVTCEFSGQGYGTMKTLYRDYPNDAKMDIVRSVVYDLAEMRIAEEFKALVPEEL